MLNTVEAQLMRDKYGLCGLNGELLTFTVRPTSYAPNGYLSRNILVNNSNPMAQELITMLCAQELKDKIIHGDNCGYTTVYLYDGYTTFNGLRGHIWVYNMGVNLTNLFDKYIRWVEQDIKQYTQ